MEISEYLIFPQLLLKGESEKGVSEKCISSMNLTED